MGKVSVKKVYLCIRRNRKTRKEDRMDPNVKNKVEYIIAVISEFAAAHSLNTLQAYRYLERFKGLDFVSRFYNVEHTLSFEDVIEDLTAYCHRKGGALV